MAGRILTKRRERYIIPTTMGSLDAPGELLRLSEHYRRMSDGELIVLARQSSELTPVAQQVLADEISQRRLKVPPEEPPAPPKPEPRDPSEPDVYDQDRQLVELCTVWSLADALQVQTLLDRAGIPFFMGPENATGADAVTSNFGAGVSVHIMQVGLPWARAVMQNYEPANEPARKDNEELAEHPVRCPKCQSTEVVFEELVGEPATRADQSPPKYSWTCDSCGYRWEDDGVVTEV